MSRCECYLYNQSKGGRENFTSTREIVLKQLDSTYKLKRKRRFKAFLDECKFQLVQDVFLGLGALKVSHNDVWILAWSDTSFALERFSTMKSYQRINHFPGMSEICKKDLLARNLKKLKAALPQYYNFFPLTFCLPEDDRALLLHYNRRKGDIFIIKPDTTSQGTGIEVVKGIPNIKKYSNVVCQKYITKPLLMESFKFDIRLYVLITSIFPLRIFVYKDGLIRLATIPYEKPNSSNMHKKRMHLTNYAINRTITAGEEVKIEEQCKKSFSDLDELLNARGVSTQQLWSTIDDIIVKTIFSALPNLEHMFHMAFPIDTAVSPCFELLGFDILLDSNCKPYLLEVNRSPSLGASSAFDDELKRNMVKNVLNMVLLTPKQIHLLKQEQHLKSIRRLTNPSATRSLTPRERILSDFQERKEIRKIGNFRKLYPTQDDRYEDIYRMTFSLKGREKLKTKSSLLLKKGFGNQRQSPEKTSSTEIFT